MPQDDHSWLGIQQTLMKQLKWKYLILSIYLSQLHQLLQCWKDDHAIKHLLQGNNDEKENVKVQEK